MIPLYLGYLIFQLYLVIGLFFKVSISASAVFFSVIVFLIWTFLPLAGYLIAKLLGARGTATNRVLFCFGLTIGALEQAWFYFNITSQEQGNLSTFIVFVLFFCVAYISLPTDKATEKESLEPPQAN